MDCKKVILTPCQKEGHAAEVGSNSQRRNFLKTITLFGGGSVLLGYTAWSKPGSGINGLPLGLSDAATGVDAATSNVFRPIDLNQINVGGEIGRRIDVTIKNNLFALDIDRDFLSPFQKRDRKDGYIGMGKLIDASVKFSAYSKSEKVLALKNHLINEIIKGQEPDGYIGMMVKESRMWGFWDIHEMGYIILGLTNDYHYFKEKRSLEAAQKVADYIIERWAMMPKDWGDHIISTYVAVIGLERTLIALYRETGDQRYLDFCVRQRALPEWNLGIVIGRRNLIEGHEYAYLARCMAQLEMFQFLPDKRLLNQSRRAINFMTAQDGMSITGAVGQWEIWTDDQDGRRGLGETCGTAYQIRLFDTFLRLEGKSYHGDVMERMIYNTLFGAQSPDGRKIRYFTPLEGNREYFDRDSYCCPNNYRRIIAELPMFVFYLAAKGVAVNLYTSSEARIALNDGVTLNIRQETNYPTSGKITLYLDPSVPSMFPLQLRIPGWCNLATASINGIQWKKPIVSGKFISLDRIWAAGDQVVLEMQMPFRLVLGRKRQSGRVAVMRGPVVFCLNPDQKDSLQTKDAADLTGIMIDSASLKLLTDNSIHPDGVACSVKAGNEGFAIGVSGELSLTLTEFTDPAGKAVYFRLPDYSVAVPDELLSGN